MSKKQKFIDRMLYWCNVADLGYDQSNRWDIRDGGECDCSSLVYWCLWEAGYGTKPANPYSQTLYTGTLARDLIAMGFTKVPNDGNPQPGDVLLNDTNHVAVCTSPGKVSQASIDENGHATGGQAGDQTGRETNTRDYYNYPWNAYYRPPAESGESTGGSAGINRKRKSMECIYRPNGADYLVYYDGVKIHRLVHPDEVTAINMVYKKCYGTDIPMFELGTKKAPWATRFQDAVNR